MRRLFVPIVIAAFAAGCGERAIMPTSPLTPGAAAHDAGTPPPPPVSGAGDAELDVFSADASSASDCSGSFTFPFSFEYFVNNDGNNAFLHIHLDGQGLDASIHETDKKLDAHGTLTGVGFTFTITDILGGSITNEDNTLPHGVSVQITGTFTNGETTCTANATLNASLGHSD